MLDWDGMARIAGFADEQSMLHYFYIKEELPVADIAKKLGVGPATVSHRLDKHQIDKRTRGGANNSQKLVKRFHRMDQRWVFGTKDTELAHSQQVHPSSVYKYKREVRQLHKPWSTTAERIEKEIQNGILHNNANSGTGTLGDSTESQTPSPSPHVVQSELP